MVRTFWSVAVLGLAGCSQGSLLTFNPKSNDSGDTAVPDVEDGGGTGDVIEQDPVYDSGGGSGSGGDGGETDPPDPTYSWASWTGQRTYALDKSDPREADCPGDTVTESGLRIEEELEEWEDLCPICSDFYEVTYSARSACGGDLDLSAPEVRGFLLRGTNLEVWRMREDGARIDVEIEFNDAPYEAGQAAFSFSETWNGEGTVTVTGTVQFPEEPAP